jgi:dolichol-phosphate mannosyltransferase
VHKLYVNRLANWFVKSLFVIPHNDLTNAFKAYRREVIDAVQPLSAQYFNITLEIPLKALNRGFGFTTVPISWYGRKAGVSKLRLREMGRKYLYTTLVCWLERRLNRDELLPSVSPAVPGKARQMR